MNFIIIINIIINIIFNISFIIIIIIIVINITNNIIDMINNNIIIVIAHMRLDSSQPKDNHLLLDTIVRQLEHKRSSSPWPGEGRRLFIHDWYIICVFSLHDFDIKGVSMSNQPS